MKDRRPTSKKRVYSGQQEVERLARWLNANAVSQDRMRVGEFVDDIQSFLKALSEDRFSDKFLRKLINPALRRFRDASDLIFVEPTDNYHGVKFGFRRREGSDFPVQEWKAFATVIALARDGNIQRLGQCVCGEYIFLKFPYGDRHQRFHPEHRHCAKAEKAREMKYYMRELREKLKTEDEDLKKSLAMQRKGKRVK